MDVQHGETDDSEVPDSKMGRKNVVLEGKLNYESRKINYNVFSTKLSLRKFISASKLLTPHQITLTESFDFHHLLDLQCEAVPTGISIWIASNFDVCSKSILLPNGSRFPITAHCVHQVLGIPYGGEKIPRKCDETLKSWVMQQTKCEGSTPTINELKALINPNLVGDQFKVVFTLFAVSSFLCPTSHAAISPEYYSAIRTPEKIGTFDWCNAVLDKIVQSIAFYQKTKSSGSTSTTTLGGCILVLVITYFELLDIPIHGDCEIVPRLKFWTTDMIKDLSRTPFWTSELHSSLALQATTKATKGCPVCCSGEEQSRRQFQAMFEHMQNDIFNAIQPIVSSYVDRFHRMWHSSGTTSCQDKGFSAIRVQDVAGKVIDQPKMAIPNSDNGNSGLLNVSSTAKDEQPKVVKSDPTSELTTFHVSLGSNENVSSEKASILSPAPVERKNDSSSVLQVPSYSQDSNSTSETAISHQAAVNGTGCLDDCPNIKNGPFVAEPRVNLLPKASDVVFPSQQCGIANNPHTKDDESSQGISPRRNHSEPKDSVETIGLLKKEARLSEGNIVTEELENPQPEAKKGGSATTATDEFCFWGSGFDSDFEINPRSEMCVPPKLDPDSVLSSKRKRPTSLNEAAYDACISRRKKAQQSSSTNDPHQPGGKVHHQNSTENSNQGFEKHVEIVDSNMLKEPRKIDAKDGYAELHTSSASLDDSPLATDDQDILYLIALEGTLKNTPSMQNRFCYNFSSTLVEKEVFKDIIDRIPFHGPSPRVVQIKKN